jgi:GTP-binding protein
MPNVGKSSFVNKILNENKSIVSDKAGTTRDSIDSFINYYNKRIRLIDTAGLRKKTKIIDAIEFYSVVRTTRSIQECDVAAILIDASKGFHGQDKSIIKHTIDNGKGLVIVINKWDLIKKDSFTMKNFKDEMIYRLPVLKYYPIIFVSIKNNLRVRNVLKKALDVYDKRKKKLKTNLLNEVFSRIVMQFPPPATKGKEVSIKYVTQIRKSPPLFGVYSNHPNLITKSYEKYLINQIRERFDFEGVPLNISFRKK